MEKKNIIVLAKKKNGRSKETNYKHFYMDKTSNLLLADSKTFHVCEDLSIIGNEVVAIEDFDFYNMNTALISFYFNELEDVEVDKEVLRNLYKYLLVTFENETRSGYDEELLKNNKAEVSKIYKLVEKWYNEDMKRK